MIEKQKLGRLRATVQLVLECKISEIWKIAWTNNKTGKELYAICPKPIQKTLEGYKNLGKVASALVVQMQMEKIGIKNFSLLQDSIRL